MEDHVGVAADGVIGGAGDVRGEDHVGQLEQGAGGRDWVGLVNVEGCTSQTSGGQGVDEGVLLDHFVEGGVDEEGVGGEGGELVGTNHAGGFGCPGGMEREEVGVLEEQFHGKEKGAAALLPFRPGVGVVGYDLHAEGGGELGYDAAHGAQADDAEGAAFQFGAAVIYVAVHGVFPLAGFDVGVEVGDAAGEGEHESYGVFRDGAGVPAGGVDDEYAVLRCGVEVDVVEDSAADADEFEVGGVLEEFFEDEIGFDDEIGYFFPLKTEAEFCRIL